MTYEEALEKIHSFEVFGSKLGLERMQKLLEALGREQDPASKDRIEASLKTLYQKIERQQALLEQAQAQQPQIPEKVHRPIAV